MKIGIQYQSALILGAKQRVIDIAREARVSREQGAGSWHPHPTRPDRFTLPEVGQDAAGDVVAGDVAHVVCWRALAHSH